MRGRAPRRRPLRAAAALAAAAGLWAWGCGDTAGGSRSSSPPAQSPAASSASSAPAPAPFGRAFADVTAASGIDFAHTTGGFGEKLLPETMGAGGCLFDADGDGHLDLFLVNSCWFSGRRPEGAAEARCAFYRGRGDGTFEEASVEAGLDLVLYGMGASAADFDGDGDLDLYVTALGDNLLLENEGGRFRDVTARAGVAGGSWADGAGRRVPEWSTASAWFDADGDLDLDLFVANYCRWTPELEVFTTLDGRTKAFTTPDRYAGLPCRLYLNRGDGTFAEAGLEAGLSAHLGRALGVALLDLEGDGRIDVAVANDTRPNFLFANRGGGRFEEQGEALGIAYDENGRARAGMGIDAADLEGDGRAELVIGNFAGEPLSLWRQGPVGFRAAAREAGLAAATAGPLTFGLGFFDVDLDGFLDLVLANGHIEPEIARFRPEETHAQPAQLFRGLPGGRFEEVGARAGEGFAAPRVGRSLLAGDIDGDGDLDLVITTNGGRAVILENRPRGEDRPHFLRVELRQQGPNTRAIGAWVTLRAGGRTQRRMVRTGSSYLGQSELALTFGLGATERVDALAVRWPDGARSEVAVSAVDRTLVVTRD